MIFIKKLNANKYIKKIDLNIYKYIYNIRYADRR